MNNGFVSAILPIIGVVIGAFLTFLAQYLLHMRQEKTELLKNAISVKNEQCLALWVVVSEVYKYLFYSGQYSEEKIDLKGLGSHIKELNMAIIKVEPFISKRSYIQLMNVRDALNQFVGDLEEAGPLSFTEYGNFIARLEEPMDKARDVLREELQLTKLGIISSKPQFPSRRKG
jgi:hypothetical protein